MKDINAPRSSVTQESIELIRQVTWDAHPLAQDRTNSFLRFNAYRESFDHNIWDNYAFGYRTSANILIQDLRHGEGMWDHIIIPLSFLFRHYIELIFKIGCKDRAVSRGEWKKIESEHNLEILWEPFKKELEMLNVDIRYISEMEKNLKGYTCQEKNVEASRFPTEINDMTPTTFVTRQRSCSAFLRLLTLKSKSLSILIGRINRGAGNRLPVRGMRRVSKLKESGIWQRLWLIKNL
jgi:hypothetical protein